ncbi:MAG: exodeoxyribonuclease VII small subunit [Acidimicrobiia bacterium]|jgi:exodeoxyribonuclease VII small subunit|nr:exodeoxyribonuclease VII small subunit [Acidimicrobiia bacterium]MDQ3392449.1 exodeoxyribonuclease VII small subunit [Actinomycetota bacterium]
MVETDNNTPDASGIGYADALAELDVILRELDGDDVDVDRLADRVERAQVLITLCRERIVKAQVRVNEIMSGDAADPEPA